MTNSSRSTRSALASSIPPPRRQREIWATSTPSTSATSRKEEKSSPSARTLSCVATAMARIVAQHFMLREAAPNAPRRIDLSARRRGERVHEAGAEVAVAPLPTLAGLQRHLEELDARIVLGRARHRRGRLAEQRGHRIRREPRVVRDDQRGNAYRMR